MLNLDVASNQTVTSVPTPTLASMPMRPGVRPRPQSEAPVIGVTEGGHDKLVQIFVGSAVALTALAGVLASFMVASSTGTAQKLRSDVDTLRQQLQVGPVADSLKLAGTVSQQLGTVTSFLQGATTWPEILDELAALLPSSAKVTAMSFDTDQALRLEGEVASQQDVATFMAALDQSEWFETPTLGSVALNESVDGSVVVFSLITKYRPSAPVASQPSPTPSSQSQAPETTPASPGPDASAGGPDAQ